MKKIILKFSVCVCEILGQNRILAVLLIERFPSAFREKGCDLLHM